MRTVRSVWRFLKRFHWILPWEAQKPTNSVAPLAALRRAARVGLMAASCCSCCLGCSCPCASILAAVLLTRTTTQQPLVRACKMRSPPCKTFGALLGELLGVSCASAQTFAAERRFTLTGVNGFLAIHTPFPIDLKAIQP